MSKCTPLRCALGSVVVVYIKIPWTFATVFSTSPPISCPEPPKKSLQNLQNAFPWGIKARGKKTMQKFGDSQDQTLEMDFGQEIKSEKFGKIWFCWIFFLSPVRLISVPKVVKVDNNYGQSDHRNTSFLYSSPLKLLNRRFEMKLGFI